MQSGICARQRLIVEYIREHGSEQQDQLATHFQVTPEAIRRDLNRLYDLEFVQRVRGGAHIFAVPMAGL
jgi:DeoR family glycerol-3-phosphate regulon repressor